VGGGGGGGCGRGVVGRGLAGLPEMRRTPPFTLPRRPRAVQAYRYVRPAASRTASEALLRRLTNELRRPAIENDVGRLPRFEMRKMTRPGRALREVTVHARSVTVTEIRAGAAVRAASAAPGHASTHSPAAVTTARAIRSISSLLDGR
jgi:hypothetical protein